MEANKTKSLLDEVKELLLFLQEESGNLKAKKGDVQSIFQNSGRGIRNPLFLETESLSISGI
jgi:hypothetical protein